MSFTPPSAAPAPASPPASGVRAPGPFLRRRNGLNLVRLVLVFGVVLSHSFTTGRYDVSPLWLGHTSGRWALAGLFTVSGFLIVSGRLRRSYLDYLSRRILRIWPLYVVCLVSIAVLFAPVDYALEHGTIDGYLVEPNGPVSFLSMNVLFEFRQALISGTPDNFGWAGNLWTVFYTVLSYAILGVVLGVRHVRARFVLVAAVFATTTVLYALRPVLEESVQDARVFALLGFLPFFSGGALIALLRHRIRLNVWVGALAFALTCVIVGLDPSWGQQASAPLFGYALLSLANTFRLPSLLERNDVAMGFFMFSVPVQQMMTEVGLNEVLGGPVEFFVVAVVATLPFAVASWWLVERPVMRWNARRAEAAAAGATAAGEVRREPPSS